MSESRKIQIGVEVDATGANQGFEAVKTGAQGMATAVERAGQQAAQGVSKIGEGAPAAGQKMEGAARSIVAAVQRVSAEMKAGEKGTADYYEALGRMRGVDINVLKPYTDELRRLQAAHAAANGAMNTGAAGLNAYGLSARQTAAALRQLPAQMTDIITSLQAGQAPLTVMLQQGGQLRDVFGGIAPAAKALGGAVLGLVNPVTVTAGVVGALAYGLHAGSEELRAFQNAATMSGSALGRSTEQFLALRDSLASIAGTKGKAAEVLAEIAKNGRISAESVQQVGEAAILMERATGQAVSKTVADFARLAQEPTKAVLDLNKAYGFLTLSTFEQIRALEEQGRITEASELATKTFADTTRDRSREVVENVGYIEAAWREVLRVVKDAGDAVKDIGREQPIAQRLAVVQGELRSVRGQDPNRRFRLPGQAGERELVAEERRLLRILEITQGNIQAEEERQRVQAAGIAAAEEVAKANERAMSKQERMNKALQDYRDEIEKVRAANPNSALLDPQKIAAAEQAIRKQFAEGGRSAASSVNRQLETRAKLLAELSGLSADFYKDWDGLTAAFKAGDLSLGQLTEKQAALLAKQPAIRAEQDAQAKATQALAKAELEAAQARDKYIVNLQTGVDKIVADTKAQEEATARIGLSREAIAALDAAKLELMATEVERQAIRNYDKNLDETEYQLALKQAQAYRDLAKAKVQGASRQQAFDDAQKAQQEQVDLLRRTDDIARDVFVQIASQGEDAFKAIGRSIKANVYDAIYRLTVRPFVIQMVGSFTGASPEAIAQAGGAAGGLSNLNNLGLLGAGVQAFTGASVGASAASLGVANAVGAVGGDALGTLIAANGGWAGVSAGAGAGAAAGAAGAMSTVAAAIPYIGAAIAIASLLSGSFKGETRVGGQYWNTDFQAGPSGGEIDGATQAIAATIDSINASLKALGSDAQLTRLVSGLEQSENGKGFAFAGGFLSTGETFGQGTDGYGWENRRGSMTAEEALAAFGEELQQATLQALQVADVPGILGDYIRSLGDIDALTGESLKKAYDRVQKALTERVSLEDRLFNLTATDLEKLNRARENERKLVDESNQALLEQIYAQEDLLRAQEEQRQAEEDHRRAIEAATAVVQRAYEQERRAAEATADQMERLRDSFRDFRDNLLTGSLSPLTPAQRYAELGSQYAILRAQAQTGNAGAMERLQDVATQFLEASQVYNASGANYQRDFAMVLADSEGMRSIAELQYDAAQEELDKLDQLVDGILDVNSAVLSVRDAIAALAQVQLGDSQNPADIINGLYRELFNRAPDSEGFDFWMSRLAAGQSVQQIREAMIYSGQVIAARGYATGLDRVPYDNFPAILHKDEAVLNADAAQAWRAGGSNSELLAAMKALGEKLDALRRENREDCGQQIGATLAAADRTADLMIRGAGELANRQQFRQRTAPTLG